MFSLCPDVLFIRTYTKSFPSIKLLLLPLLVNNAFGQSFDFTENLHTDSETYYWSNFSQQVNGSQYLPIYYNSNPFPNNDGSLPCVETVTPNPFVQTSDSQRLYGGHDLVGSELQINNIVSSNQIDYLIFQIMYHGYSLTNNTYPSSGVESNHIASVIYDSVYLTTDSLVSNIAPTSIEMTYNVNWSASGHGDSFLSPVQTINFIWELEKLSLYSANISWRQKHSSVLRTQISFSEINYNLAVLLSNNLCFLNFNSSSGITYSVNTCTNLMENEWNAVTNITATTTNVNFSHTIDHDVLFWTITEAQ